MILITFDTETGYYYLQSRYYNSEIDRFLNADGLISTGQGLIGSNMFAYCLNSPVNRRDDNGFVCISITEGATTWKNESSTSTVSQILYYGKKFLYSTGDYYIGEAIVKAYENSVTKSYKPINL
jgi:RHS repeat-associated protein